MPLALLVALTVVAGLRAEPAEAAEPADLCPPNVHEAHRPAAPCLVDDRIYTPRLDWTWGRAAVPAAVQVEMKRVAALLMAHPAITRIRIEAHESDQTGRNAFGRCVTCRRAEALRDLLVQAGVDGARIETQGYGETRPVFDPRDPTQNRLNDRFEWHVLQRAPAVDRAALAALSRRWAPCLRDRAGPLGITLLLDEAGRLATVVLDRPGPLRCLTRAVGAPLGAGPARVTWPAPDKPALHPPPPVGPPAVPGHTCPDGTTEGQRPPAACIARHGARIWLPPVPRSPKSSEIPPKAWPALDRLVALLRDAPQIARVRIEAHDYRDPHAGDRAACHVCRRAAAMRKYLLHRGIAEDRIAARGHDVSRPPPGRGAEGPPRYELHIEGWQLGETSAPREQGEVNANVGPQDAEEVSPGAEGKFHPERASD